MKKYLCMLLSVVLFISFNITAMAINDDAVSTDDIFIAEKSPINELIESLDEDSYGGAYYDNNGNLVILSLNDSALQRSALLTNAIKNDVAGVTVRLETAQYSMAELTTARDRLLDQADKFDIVAAGFYEPDNTLCVYVADITDEKKSAIKEEVGIERIRFFESTGAFGNDVPEASAHAEMEEVPYGISPTVRPGQWVYMHRISSNWSTVMIPAVRNYQQSNQQLGFLTVAHGWQVGDTASNGNVSLGTCSNIWRGTYADAAFIPSNRTQSLTSKYSKYITSRGNAIANMTVWLQGANGEQSGIVLATGVTFPMSAHTSSPVYPALTYKNCFTFNFTPIAGDSGGALISKNTNNNNYSIKGYNIGYFGATGHGVACQWNYLEDTYNILPAQLN